MNRTNFGVIILFIAACATGGRKGSPGVGTPSSGGSSGAGLGAAGGSSPHDAGTDAAGKSGATGRAGTPAIGVGGTATGSAGATDLEPDAACGIGSAEATLRPVSMFVMFDRSTSMVRDEPDPVTMLTRWATATSALKAFFGEPAASGLGVALRFFPDDRPAAGCTQEGCDMAACAQPLVDFGVLTADPAPADMQEAALVAAIEDATPMLPMNGMMAKGGTPISVALEGALTWAASRQAAVPDGRTVVLFVTDGAPSGCDERIPFIADLAASALAESNVSTYAVGLANAQGEGVHQDDMDSIATAGGTEHAYFIKDGPTAADELLSALDAIRGMAVPCDFPVPSATAEGQPVDPHVVNVTYAPGTPDELALTKSRDAADCEASMSWYYDDEDAPSRIILCPAACTQATADRMARFQILVGCAPILKEPR